MMVRWSARLRRAARRHLRRPPDEPLADVSKAHAPT